MPFYSQTVALPGPEAQPQPWAGPSHLTPFQKASTALAPLAARKELMKPTTHPLIQHGFREHLPRDVLKGLGVH